MKTRFRGATLSLMIVLAFTLAITLISTARTASAAGPVTVQLGTAAAFAVLAGTPAVTNTGVTPATVITGDLGIHPAASVTGFPPGLVAGAIHTADAVALQAKSDLASAYVDAAGRPATATYATLGGRTLVGGVYNAGGATLGLTGTLTLDAQNDPSSVWIFQATSDLVTASSSVVTFINGGQPCNVFWQVTSSATLGSGSTFIGTIMALTDITMGSTVSVNGRALARNGQVTLISDNIRRSTCAAPQPEETSGPTVTPAVATATPTRAVATATPAGAATATPVGAATATPAASAAPVGAVVGPAAPTAIPAGSLPSTSTQDDTPVVLILPVIALGVLYLLARRRRAYPVN